MPWTQVSLLPVMWWNTGLSPPIPKLDSTDADREFVAEQIQTMHRQLPIGLFGLGEVCSDDLALIMDKLNDKDLELVDSTDRTKKLKLDTALIYDTTRLVLEKKENVVTTIDEKRLKTAQRARFKTSLGDRIDVFYSHWPSRLGMAEWDPKRAQLGMSLRSAIDRNITEDGYYILMGDYNDDPSSPSLAYHLRATRDRTLAIKRKRSPYNPFWRKLGESMHHEHSTGDDSVCGTCFYRGGDYSQWHTFDQVIFSSAFLGDEQLTLEESYTDIMASDDLKSRIKRERFDHFPVLSCVSMRSKI